MISHHKSKLILLGLPTPAFYFKTDIFPVLQKLTHITNRFTFSFPLSFENFAFSHQFNRYKKNILFALSSINAYKIFISKLR